ncbi:coagulation factor 5/8 type domain-containing protein, partial [Streptomyces sp. NPDC005786]
MHVPPTEHPTTPPTGNPTTSRRRHRNRTFGFAAFAVSLLMAFPTAQTAFGEDAQAIQGGGDLGPNVMVFDPSTPDIQAKVDAVFKQQESAQFGTGRYALMFKPGTY